MANITLIIGESGTGKSTSIRTLDPKETFIINVLDKPLPFKGGKKNYVAKVNYSATDNYEKILACIRYINTKMPEIKNIIIDDFQYILANEFMRRARENGYGKFTEIAQHAWSVISESASCRDDLYFFFLSHSDTDQFGKSRCKTIGKMLDDKVCVEGMFTVVLHSMVEDGQYMFLTQNNGQYLAKSPMGLFPTLLIDNNLEEIKEAMLAYYNDEEIKNESIPS